MQDVLSLEVMEATLSLLRSRAFRAALRKLVKQTKGRPIQEATKELDKFEKKTLDGLSERQAEAITLEHMYFALLENRVKDEHVLKYLSDLGYKVNPNPLAWLRKKLTVLRQWIIDAVKWLRMVGETLLLSVKEINIEIGVSPKVSITFTPRRTAPATS